MRSSSVQRSPQGVPRHLLPPAGLGSATNVGPGFYRQLDAPQGATPHPPAVGVGVVYILPAVPVVYGAVAASPYAVGPVEVGVEPVRRDRDEGRSEVAEPGWVEPSPAPRAARAPATVDPGLPSPPPVEESYKFNRRCFPLERDVGFPGFDPESCPFFYN